MEDKVSVIIPNYNAAAYLERTVESVLKQTYSNIEIIIVDDCSTDNSADICRSIALRHASVSFFIKNKNEGQLSAWKIGIQHATGKWIIFLDADDKLANGAVEQLVQVAKETNVDIVFAGYESIGFDGVKVEYKANIKEGLYSAKEFGKALFNGIETNILTCVGSKLYNTEFLRNRKIDTIPLRENADMAFVIDALLSCESIYYLDEVCYIYLLRDGSKTYSYMNDMYPAISCARRRIREYLEKCGCYEEKKLDLEMMQYSLINKALSQEIKFKKGYAHFKETLHSIAAHERTKETVDTILGADVSGKYKMFMRLVAKDRAAVLYMLLSLKGKMHG